MYISKVEEMLILGKRSQDGQTTLARVHPGSSKSIWLALYIFKTNVRHCENVFVHIKPFLPLCDF